MIHQGTVVLRSSDLVSAPLGEELALMDLESGTYFVLDAVGTAIWDRIGQPTAVGSLCQQLSSRFDVSIERCQADVIRFLEDMAGKRLVALVGDG